MSLDDLLRKTGLRKDRDSKQIPLRDIESQSIANQRYRDKVRRERETRGGPSSFVVSRGRMSPDNAPLKARCQSCDRNVFFRPGKQYLVQHVGRVILGSRRICAGSFSRA